MRVVCLTCLVLLLPAVPINAEQLTSSTSPTKDRDADDCKCTASRLTKGSYDPIPCYCIQQLYMDYPGPYDLYVCITEYGPSSCGEDPQQELWYGPPHNAIRPQVCTQTGSQCETDGYWVSALRAQGIPGHGCSQDSKAAWHMAQAALNAAKPKVQQLEWQSPPEFHVIPRVRIPDSAGATGDVTVMAIKVKGKFPSSDWFFLCLQIDSINTAAGDVETIATFAKDGISHGGRQVQIEYVVKGETRKGLVWLK